MKMMKMLMCDTSIKKLSVMNIEVFTTPFKQKATEKVFINTVEGLTEYLSRLVEARKKLSDELTDSTCKCIFDYTLRIAKRKPASKRDCDIVVVGIKLKHYCPAFENNSKLRPNCSEGALVQRSFLLLGIF